MCVCVCARCAHDAPRLRASSKALSGALCGPRSLPFLSPSFCLSVSYLIELAHKQSSDGTWGWGEGLLMPGWSVSLSASVSPSTMILSSESMSSRSKGSTMMSPYSVGTARSLRQPPPPLCAHTHLPAFKQVSWLISDTHMEWRWNTNRVQILSFAFISALPSSNSILSLVHHSVSLISL